MTNYTLELFRLFIERKPIGAPEAVLQQALTDIRQLEHQETVPEQIEAIMVRYGLELWPYFQAEARFMEKYGNERKMALFKEKLPPVLKEKWINFENQGGSIHNFRNGDHFEQAFTPEENSSIESAMLDARSEIKQELLSRALAEQREEYDVLVKEAAQERDQILQKLDELAALKAKQEKWDDDIDEFIDYTRKGFAELEERPTVEKVQGKIDFCTGQIESGNV